uniref:PKD domain-containing protein n=1 Tax=Periophthalmus magnuspinnatus TaxID=409849 RepID=A0A3B4AZA7_9GOBI
MVQLEDGDAQRTTMQLDFGDGIRITYSNLSRTNDGIRHIYRTTGIYRVSAHAQNSQGSDSSALFLHVTSPVERIYLSSPIVTVRGKEANLSVLVWPNHTRTLTFFWWFDNSSEPLITLEGRTSHTFQRIGQNKVTVQVASGSNVMQDSKVITVKDYFRSLLLSFSPALDEHNPDIPEWREDIGRVVFDQGIPFQLLVSLYPGLPTTAELFILPDAHVSGEHKRRSEELDTISDIFVTALNQGLVQFELKANIRIIVYVTQQTLAPLVDSNSIHSGPAMLMLLSVVIVGVAAFFIYKFKRWLYSFETFKYSPMTTCPPCPPCPKCPPCPICPICPICPPYPR